MIYVSRIENGETINEGLCLRCAKELGLAPVDDMMKKMGISEEDLDNISAEISELMEDEDFSPGGAPSLNLLNSFLGRGPAGGEKDAAESAEPDAGTREKTSSKRIKRSRSRRSISILTATASTSPSRRATASSTVSSAGKRKFTAWCRFSTAAPRTIPA